MERVSNNEFKRKTIPEKTQYLKDADDDHETCFKSLNTKLKAIIGLLSTMFLMVAGYLFDLIFLT